MNAKVATPTPTPFDMNENFKWLAGCLTFFLSYLYYINLWFKNRAKDKQEFIVEVVKETVKVTLASELSNVRSTLGADITDIKGDVQRLFDFREADRNHWDNQFKEVIKEIRKP